MATDTISVYWILYYTVKRIGRVGWNYVGINDNSKELTVLVYAEVLQMPFTFGEDKMPPKIIYMLF